MAFYAKKHLDEAKERHEGEFGIQNVVMAELEEQVEWYRRKECIH